MTASPETPVDWPPDGPPSSTWHSFDATPWLHPWLTRPNLEAMREASTVWRKEAREVAARAGTRTRRYAFVGNMANQMYMRAKSLSRQIPDIDVFGLHGDDSALSDPRWEEYDGIMPATSSYLGGDKIYLSGIEIQLPYEQFSGLDSIPASYADVPNFIRESDFATYREYFGQLPSLERLQAYDAVFATQHAFMGYLSGRPYVATQAGGDIWYEAARDDVLGRLQRVGFREAACVAVSNPWGFAHARRYGFRNLIYLPLTLDETAYSPGEGHSRAEWAKGGGTFFALTTARVDETFKGSGLGIRGFARFSERHPGARLVIVGWGQDLQNTRTSLERLGIADKVIFVPVSGKRAMVDYLRSADCLIDQFRLGYYGATALEAAACGLPIIMRLESAQYDALCRTGAPPFLEAATPNEVTNALEMLIARPEDRRANAERHRRWFLDNHSGATWADDYQAILTAVALGHRFSFETSPLNEPLSRIERLYHAEQLASAPEFPNYVGPADIAFRARAESADYPELLDLAIRAAWSLRDHAASIGRLEEAVSRRIEETVGRRIEEFMTRISSETAARVSGDIGVRLDDLYERLDRDRRADTIEARVLRSLRWLRRRRESR